jgi:hypothetical protein
MKCEGIASAFGYKIGPGSKELEFNGIGALRSIVESDPAFAAACFSLCAQIAQKTHFDSVLLVGISALARHMNEKYKFDFFDSDYVNSLIDAGTVGCRNAIRREKYATGVGGEVSAARGLLAIVNKKRSTRRLVW